VLLAEPMRVGLRRLLVDVQHDLFDLGGELAIPGSALLKPAAVDKLERAIDLFNDDLPALKEFLLPGGTRAAGSCHLARAVCRRTERSVLALAADEPINVLALTFINRLSDLLFVAARVLARDSGAGEVMWQRQRG
jgi:cob(I)alamin adenosyltransferase